MAPTDLLFLFEGIISGSSPIANILSPAALEGDSCFVIMLGFGLKSRWNWGGGGGRFLS